MYSSAVPSLSVGRRGRQRVCRKSVRPAMDNLKFSSRPVRELPILCGCSNLPQPPLPPATRRRGCPAAAGMPPHRRGPLAPRAVVDVPSGVKLQQTDLQQRIERRGNWLRSEPRRIEHVRHGQMLGRLLAQRPRPLPRLCCRSARVPASASINAWRGQSRTNRGSKQFRMHRRIGAAGDALYHVRASASRRIQPSFTMWPVFVQTAGTAPASGPRLVVHATAVVVNNRARWRPTQCATVADKARTQAAHRGSRARRASGLADHAMLRNRAGNQAGQRKAVQHIVAGK